MTNSREQSDGKDGDARSQSNTDERGHERERDTVRREVEQRRASGDSLHEVELDSKEREQQAAEQENPDAHRDEEPFN